MGIITESSQSVADNPKIRIHKRRGNKEMGIKDKGAGTAGIRILTAGIRTLIWRELRELETFGDSEIRLAWRRADMASDIRNQVQTVLLQKEKDPGAVETFGAPTVSAFNGWELDEDRGIES